MTLCSTSLHPRCAQIRQHHDTPRITAFFESMPMKGYRCSHGSNRFLQTCCVQLAAMHTIAQKTKPITSCTSTDRHACHRPRNWHNGIYKDGSRARKPTKCMATRTDTLNGCVRLDRCNDDVVQRFQLDRPCESGLPRGAAPIYPQALSTIAEDGTCE